jgi:hypothetical protein
MPKADPPDTTDAVPSTLPTGEAAPHTAPEKSTHHAAPEPGVANDISVADTLESPTMLPVPPPAPSPR